MLQLHSDIKAQLIVYGTPAEESGGGKALMVEKGSFDEVDICMMSHPSSKENPSPIALAISVLTITFHGNSFRDHLQIIVYFAFSLVDRYIVSIVIG